MRNETNSVTESSKIAAGDQKPLVAAHTPTPWRTEINEAANTIDLYGANGQTTILAVLSHEPEVGIYGDPDGAAADMAFIVRACNAHDDMLAALRICLARLRLCRDEAAKENLISKAEGINSAVLVTKSAIARAEGR